MKLPGDSDIEDSISNLGDLMVAESSMGILLE